MFICYTKKGRLKLEKQVNKKINIKRLLLYVSAVLILISAIAYFIPFIVHTEPYSLSKTYFSGWDFTKALISDDVNTKILATKSLLEMESTKMVAYFIAVVGPICFVYSCVMFLLTLLSTYYEKLNNIFSVGGFFAVWVALFISIIFLVGKLAVTKGDVTINNYAVHFSIIISLISVLSASVINIYCKFIE